MAHTIVADRGEPRLLLDSIVIEGRYSLRNPDGSVPKEFDGVTEVSALGAGSFGVVVRAVDRLGLERVVKFMCRGQSLSPNAAISEIRNANARPFKHVVPVIDYGTVLGLAQESRLQESLSGSQCELSDVPLRTAASRESRPLAPDTVKAPIQYYISPYVHGRTLDVQILSNPHVRRELASSPVLLQRTRDATLDLMDQLLGALEELSTVGLCHMDLKPQNILLYSPAISSGHAAASEDAFVIDLGGAKSYLKPRGERTTLICTEYYFPLHLLDALDLDEGQIATSALRALGPVIDIYCLGRVFERMFLDRVRLRSRGVPQDSVVAEDEPGKERFWKSVFWDDFAMLESVIRRMLDTDRSRTEGASSYRRKLASIPRAASPDMLASSVLTDLRPALHVRVGRQFVRVSPPFERLVDHPVFQRLRLVQQLALVSQVYPDGTHTRFAHCLRTFAMAKQAILALRRNSAMRLLFDREDVDTVLAGALLHDLGQYHFSHTVEDLRKEGDIRGIRQLQGISYDQELVALRLSEKPGGAPSLRELLADMRVDVDALLYMVDKGERRPEEGAVRNIGRDLISGLIDVDRISYLVHDSEKTGVPYGSAIDVGTLLEGLTLLYEEQPNGQGDGAALAIEEEAVSAVEAVLTSVYWMYRDVYWHRVNRGFMAAVKWVLRRLLLEGECTFEAFLDETVHLSDWEALCWLSARYDALLSRREPLGTNPLGEMVAHRRLGYRRVLSLRWGGADGEELYERVVQAVRDGVEDVVLGALRREIDVDSPDGSVLLDVPLKRRLPTGTAGSSHLEDTKADLGRRAVLNVACRDYGTGAVKRWLPIEDYSPLVRGLGKQEDHSGRRIRVFVARQTLARLSDAAQSSLEGRLRNVLDAVVPRFVRRDPGDGRH